MLGSKLIKKADFETDFETQTLELLKLRFLESELHHCDVMLKDMQVRAPRQLSLSAGHANAVSCAACAFQAASRAGSPPLQLC